MKLILLAVLIHGGSLPVFAAMPFTESTLTEVIHVVNVVASDNKETNPAKTGDTFKTPDLVRTGRDSRVELTAKDQTITRVGANTTFSYAQSGREIQLKEGSVLFHSPSGAGGGTIKYKGSSAAVLGTTVIAEVMPDGSFKVLVLEGTVTVTSANGLSVVIKPGQSITVSPDGNAMGPVMSFHLGELASHLLLVVGFSQPLSSQELIGRAIQQQNQEISAGVLTIAFSWQDSGTGLDLAQFAINDSNYYLHAFSAAWNPLDFPTGQNGWVISIPLHLPAINGAPVIKPPLVTNPNPPVTP